MSKDNLPSNKEPVRMCEYNKGGVCCPTPIKDRQCGKCGWRPSVAKKRLEAIKERRQEELRNA